jgi:hypothetical protein
MSEGTGAPEPGRDWSGASVPRLCGHPRRLEDLLDRGEWRCQLEVGHSGSHAATLGSDSCRWDDAGDVPIEAVGVPQWLDVAALFPAEVLELVAVARADVDDLLGRCRLMAERWRRLGDRIDALSSVAQAQLYDAAGVTGCLHHEGFGITLEYLIGWGAVRDRALDASDWLAHLAGDVEPEGER